MLWNFQNQLPLAWLVMIWIRLSDGCFHELWFCSMHQIKMTCSDMNQNAHALHYVYWSFLCIKAYWNFTKFLVNLVHTIGCMLLLQIFPGPGALLIDCSFFVLLAGVVLPLFSCLGPLFDCLFFSLLFFWWPVKALVWLWLLSALLLCFIKFYLPTKKNFRTLFSFFGKLMTTYWSKQVVVWSRLI